MATGYKADGVITIGTSVDVGGINTGLKKITKSMDKISGMAKSILGIGLFTKLGNEAINYASDLTEVENIVDVSFKSMRNKIDTFTKTCIEMYGISELTAKQTAGSFAAMGNAMNLTLDESTSMAVALTQLSANMASFYNISQDYARVALSAVYTGETETLKRYGVVLTEANLQEYAQTLGIEKSVKAMSAREKLILRYKYIMHTMDDIQGDFARTSGTWANQIRILQERWRQLLIVLGTGLKSVLLPVVRALNVALQVTISWAKAIGAVLARLFGIKFEDTISGTAGALDDVGTSAGDAADAEDDLADSTKAAGKAAEKALGPYDKLNVIQKDTASGSGGTGGVGGDALDLDFSDLDLGSGTSIFDRIKDDLLDINSFYELGEYIATNLTNMLRNIPWDTVYEGARKFGTGLAEFLNGIVDHPELFYEMGATLAKTLNAVVYAALDFANTFHFDQLGKDLAIYINGIFENWDAAATAQAISAWVEGIWDIILNFFATLDYSTIFSKIHEFISNLSPATIMTLLGIAGFKIALKALLKQHIGEAFIEGFRYAITGQTTKGVIALAFENLGVLLGNKITGTGKQIKAAAWASQVDINDVLDEGLTKAYGTMCDAEIMAGNTASNISTTAINAATDTEAVVTAKSTSIVSSIGSIIAKLAGLAAIAGGVTIAGISFFDIWNNGFSLLRYGAMMAGIALTALGAILLGANPLVAGVVAAVVAAVATIILVVKNFDQVKEYLANLGAWIKDKWNALVDWFSKAWDKLTEFVRNAFGKIKEFFDNQFELLQAEFEAWWNAMTGILQAHFDFINAQVDTFVHTIWEFLKQLFGWIKDIFDDIMQLGSDIIKFFQDVFKGDWEAAWNDIVDIFRDIWNLLADIAIGPINAVIALVNGLIESVENAANFIVDCVNSIAFDVPDWVPLIGGKHLGFNLSPVSLGRIPYLAQGAVIPPNKEFMAVLGDQKQGTNIETPLKTMIDAFNKALDDRGGTNSGDIIIEIDGKEVFRAIRKQNKEYKNVTGKSAFA